jgi:hypothetical protein
MKKNIISLSKRKIYAALWEKANSEAEPCHKDHALRRPQFIQTQEEAIEVSKKIMDALDETVKAHNLGNENKKATLSQLKKAYRHGAEDYREENATQKTCNEWAMARVSMFLRAGKGESYSWAPTEEDFCRSEEIIEKFGLHLNFNSIDELFLETNTTRCSSRGYYT